MIFPNTHYNIQKICCIDLDLPYVCITHFSHPIPFPFFIFSTIPFHFIFFQTIPFHFIFFLPFFFNFPNPYTISLNLNHSYHLEISKVKPFLHHFYKPFSNYSKPFLKPFFPSHFHPNKWDGMAKMGKPNTC